MARARFVLAASLALMFALPAALHAQTRLSPGPGLQQQQQAPPQAAPTPAEQPSADTQSQPDTGEVGNVATVTGSATVTRNGTSQDLKVKDPILKGDVLRTGPNATLGVIFDDETTFNLSANASIEVNEFIYESGGKNNSALFNIARGTVAFAANQVAKTGDMKISTPSTTLGIRGTTGVIDVPEGATPGSTGEVAVKLYQDEDGRVGRIELFQSAGGPQIGLLTRASTGFSLRAGAGGRFAAVPLTISPQQVARDRAFVQRTFAARSTGRSMINQRMNLRRPGLQRPNQRQQNLHQPGRQQQRGNNLQNTPRNQNQPGNNLQRQNPQRQNLQQPNPRRQQVAPRGRERREPR